MFDVERFISAVKERPALYDAAHLDYSRKVMRTRLWHEIGGIIYDDWHQLDVRDRNEKEVMMQKKWKSLKDCFSRELRMQKTSDPNKIRKQYEFYDKLSFLLQTNKSEPGKQMETLREDTIKLEKPEKRLEPPYVQKGTENPRKRKIESYTQPKRQKNMAADDSDRMFLLSFVHDMQKLPLTTKYWVKMKFSEVMHQAGLSLGGYLESEVDDVSFEETGSQDGEALHFQGTSPPSSDSEIHDITL